MSEITAKSPLQVVGIVPAAGTGARMQLDLPKQYMRIAGQTILEHSILALLSDPRIERVIVALNPADTFFSALPLAADNRIQTVEGGDDRAGSVSNALEYIHTSYDRPESVLCVVHDAARPCLSKDDLAAVLDYGLANPSQGALLALPVRDTMKRSNLACEAIKTEERSHLWHALTPQVFLASALRVNLLAAREQGVEITDESSAMEWGGQPPKLINGQPGNIKVTYPHDLEFVANYLVSSKNKDNEI